MVLADVGRDESDFVTHFHKLAGEAAGCALDAAAVRPEVMVGHRYVHE
jgi:hypothetical protein